MALSNVGGSITMLEEAFDQLSSQRSRGPRDGMVKEVLAKLLTYQRLDYSIACIAYLSLSRAEQL